MIWEKWWPIEKYTGRKDTTIHGSKRHLFHLSVDEYFTILAGSCAAPTPLAL
jgi:hypothetical protein